MEQDTAQPAETAGDGAPETAWALPKARPTQLVEKALGEWDETVQRVREFAAARQLSKAEAWRRSQVPAGTASSWYDGTYKGDVRNITVKMQRWLAAEADNKSALAGAGQLIEPGFVWTSTAREVHQAMIYAQTAPAMVVVTLGPGMGKTTVARHVVETRPHAYRIVMRPSTASVHSMLREISNVLGVGERDPGKLARSVGEKLRRNGRHTLVMIDEAQNLSESAVNELRYFMDEYGCGIALLGNEDLHVRHGGSQPREGYGQIHRRIGMRIRRLYPTAEDIDTFVAAWGLQDAELKKLARAIGRKPGALGQVTESLRLASIIAGGRGEPMTADDLRQAWVNRGGEDIR